MTEFSCGTRIISGTGAASALGTLGGKRVLVVTDPFFMKNGTAERLGALAAGEEYACFDRVAPDPTVALAAEGTAQVSRFRPDLIVALGGGSAIDCAKAMLYFSGSGAKLVAIPTTSGSGSEVTDFAVLTHGEVKHPLVDPRLRPWVAILDDGLLTELPPSLVADSGFDAISHALEALAATKAGAVTDALATEAFRRVLGALPMSFAGQQGVRLELHTASTMAAMAFTQAGLGVCHALAHSLGGLYHIPHGRLNAIVLPRVVEFNRRAMGKYAAAARAAGLGGSTDTIGARNLVNGLIRLRRQLRLPETLAQAGIPPAQVAADQDRILSAALADVCCQTNPEPVDREGLCRLLREVTGRG